MQSGTRQGPCGNPACPAPAKSAGQWQRIPSGFSGALRPGASCTCKKAGCQRYFLLKGDPQKPGRTSGRCRGGDRGAEPRRPVYAGPVI